MGSKHNVHDGADGGKLRFEGASRALERRRSDPVFDGEEPLISVGNPDRLVGGRRSLVALPEGRELGIGRTDQHKLRSVLRSYNVDDWDDEDDPYDDDEDEDDEEDEFFPDDEDEEEDEDVDEFDFDEDLDA